METTRSLHPSASETHTNKKISIIGAGAMGRALSCLINDYKKREVKLWGRNSELISKLMSKIPKPPHQKFGNESKDIFLSTDLKVALEDSDLVILAVPSFAVREVCQKISNSILPPILMISKGLEKKTSLLPFQVVKEVLGMADILHLTWSRFAEDIYRKTNTCEILASEDKNLSKKFKSLFETDWLSISTSTDLLGVELAGALKNVIVIGVGLADQEKPEIKQKLIEEGVQEMIELGKVMGAREETFRGPAGKINLELSADSRSRNYCLGRDIYQKGFKKTEKELKEKNITIEGIETTFAAYQLTKKYKLKLPMIEEVYKVIYERKNPKLSAKNLTKLVS